MTAKVQETAQKLQSFLDSLSWLDKTAVNIEFDFPEAVVDKSRIHALLKELKENPSMGFTFLTTLCGIHFPSRPGQEFCIMYQLHNLYTNERVRLYSFTDEGNPTFATITDLWPAANWMEREAFDFYGIHFEGHPNLIRILNVEDMDYHPLRKEYRLEDDTRTDKDDTYFGR